MTVIIISLWLFALGATYITTNNKEEVLRLDSVSTGAVKGDWPKKLKPHIGDDSGGFKTVDEAIKKCEVKK